MLYGKISLNMKQEPKINHNWKFECPGFDQELKQNNAFEVG